MRVTLFTATGAENLGDELIALCEIRELLKVENISIALFSHDVARTKRFLASQNCPLEQIVIQEYFPNALRKQPLKNIILLWQTIMTIAKTDRVYIGGGGLLYSKNEEWHSPLLLWSFRAMMSKILRKQITYLSIGITTTEDELKPYTDTLLENTVITVRDTESKTKIQNLWYTAEVLPDPVWNLDTEKLKTQKTIGVAFRKGFLPDAVVSEMMKKLQKEGYEILLLPHSLHPTDENSHDGYYLQNFLFPGVKTSQSIEQTLEYYKQCHIVLAMRFHSMILASIHSIPFVGISYGKKTSSLLSEMNWKYSFSENIDSENIINAVKDIELHYGELQNQLQNISSSMRKKYKSSSVFLWK